MLEVAVFIVECLITTLLTITVMALIFILAVYFVGATVMTITAFKYKFKSRFMFLNPINIIKYGGTKRTIYMGSGDLIIDYFGYFPKVTFIEDK